MRHDAPVFCPADALVGDVRAAPSGQPRVGAPAQPLSGHHDCSAPSLSPLVMPARWADDSSEEEHEQEQEEEDTRRAPCAGDSCVQTQLAAVHSKQACCASVSKGTRQRAPPASSSCNSSPGATKEGAVSRPPSAAPTAEWAQHGSGRRRGGKKGAAKSGAAPASAPDAEGCWRPAAPATLAGVASAQAAKQQEQHRDRSKAWQTSTSGASGSGSSNRSAPRGKRATGSKSSKGAVGNAAPAAALTPSSTAAAVASPQATVPAAKGGPNQPAAKGSADRERSVVAGCGVVHVNMWQALGVEASAC